MVDILESFALASNEITANKLDENGIKVENNNANEKMGEDEDEDDDEYDEDVDVENLRSLRLLRRSKTMPTSGSAISDSTTRLIRLNKSLKENSMIMQSCNNLSSTTNLKLNLNPDRLKMAKDEAERAIKERKIFSIVGPYDSLRKALRRRGWIEKFENLSLKSTNKHPTSSSSLSSSSASSRKKVKELNEEIPSSDDDADDEEEEEDVKPWEENNGYYGILSRLVKNFNPSFIFTVKPTTIDYPYLTKDQIVNHYNKNGAFTTKIGLCSNIRNTSWHCSENCDEFFPRCYKLCQEDERKAFIDDYRITSCIGLLKYFLIKYRNESEEDFLDVHITSAEELAKLQKNREQQGIEEEEEYNENNETSRSNNKPQTIQVKANDQSTPTPMTTTQQTIKPVTSSAQPSNHKRSSSISKSSKSVASIPVDAIEFAIEQLELFVDFKESNDLDLIDFNLVGEEKWQKFSEWFYAACHDKKPFQSISESLFHDVIRCLEMVRTYCPQYEIDGFRNIWIVKPGALSRGRGIIVFDKLENILELNRSPLQRDGKYVVQKYIERPLLIHKIKFDIRQWFMVTDFNPLTIWMYKDCYLRFCTQKFTLDTTQQSVHLCNYSIQKNYKNDTERDQELPEENMWSSEEFISKYLARQGLAHKWDELIYPGMKRAILSAMLSSQDIVEARKNTFELYGADFMLGEDLKPWLIEINCSPTMAKSTAVTKILCDVVLEDVCRVVLDRRANRNADTGRFELIHRASPVSVPSYIGIDLKVDGLAYKKAQLQLSPQQQQQQQQQSSQQTSLIISPSSKSQSQSQHFSISSSSILVTSSSISSNNNSNPNTNPSPVKHHETVNITSLDIKQTNRTPANTKVAQVRTPISPTYQHVNKSFSLLSKETTLPAIALSTNKTTTTSRDRTDLMSLYRSIENQTNYLLKPTVRHSVSDMRVVRKRDQSQPKTSTSSINEPKLFEFNSYQPPALNKINRPFIIKRTSLPSYHLVKLSKTTTFAEKFINDLTIKPNKRFKKPKNKTLLVSNKLDASDLNSIDYNDDK